MGFATKVKMDEFKGNAMIVLDCEGKYPFQFGKGKAKLIVEHFAAIKEFAEGKPAPAGGEPDFGG